MLGEMVLGFNVIALMSIFSLYFLIAQGQREMQTRQLVHSIIGGVRGIYTSSVEYDGLSAAMLANASRVPENHVRGTTAAPTIETPFGGEVKLGGWDGGWSMALVNERKETCIAIFTEFVDGTGFQVRVTGAANVASVPSPLVDGSATPTDIIDSVADINAAFAGTNKNLVLEFR